MKFFKICVCVISVFLLCGGASVSVKAQQPVGKLEQALNSQVIFMLASHKQGAAAIITARIDDMQHALQLSQQQATELRVASKDVMKSYASNVTAKMVRKLSLQNFIFNPDADPDTMKQAAVQKQDQELLRKSLHPIYQWLGNPRRVEEEKLWKTTIEKVLTDQQVTELQRWDAKRDAYRQSAAVDFFVARADEALLLTKEQKKQLFIVINEKFGESLANKLDDSIYRYASTTKYSLPKIASEVDMSLVDSILSESQLSLWKVGLGIELLMLEEDKKAKE